MPLPLIPRAARCSAAALLLISATVLVGCAGKGDISGKVSYKGKALPYGNVQFQSADGLVVPATIQADGTYKASGVPSGNAKVSVTCMDEEGAVAWSKAMSAVSKDPSKKGAMPKGNFGDFNKIPEKYNNFGTSGLSFDVKSGQQVYDIELN